MTTRSSALGAGHHPARLDRPRPAPRLAADHRRRAWPPASRSNLLLPLVAYESLLEGATGLTCIDLDAAGRAQPRVLDRPRSAPLRALTSTVAAAAPLVLTGLAVGVGFKAGLFNIGGTGQVLVGGVHRRPRRRRRRRAAGPRGGHRRAAGRRPRRGALRVHPRRAQGVHGCPRSRVDDHAQLAGVRSSSSAWSTTSSRSPGRPSRARPTSGTRRCRSCSAGTGTWAS